MKAIYLIFSIITFSIVQSYGNKVSITAIDSVETNIVVKVKNHHRSDTISLTQNGPFFDYILLPNTGRHALKTISAIVNKNGDYHFKFKTDKNPLHVSIFLSNERFEDYVVGRGDICNYLLMPGSNFTIEFDGNSRTYSGKGAEIFEIQEKIENTDKGSKILDDNTLASENTPKWLVRGDSLLTVQLNLLDTYKSRISPLSYSIIRADVIGLSRGALYYWLSNSAPFRAKRIDLTQTIADGYEMLKNMPYYLDLNDPACLSPTFAYFLYEKAKLEVKYERVMKKLPPRVDQNYFENIKSKYHGTLRDKLIARWITDLSSVNNLHQNEVSEALEIMRSPYYIKIVKKLNSGYEKGQPITDMDFHDDKGNIVRLKDYRRKVVVVDMWFTGCPECIEVVKGMPNVENKFKDRKDVVFITVSIDRDKNTWLKSINKNGGKYFVTPNTIYLYTSGTGTRNPFIEKYVQGNGYPQLLIIGKDGTLFSAALPHPINKELQEKFSEQIATALSN
jgi:thiol-disulfide isomerase/thioredoxin